MNEQLNNKLKQKEAKFIAQTELCNTLINKNTIVEVKLVNESTKSFNLQDQINK